MPEIVLATGNPHKVEEMRAIFASLGATGGLRLLGLEELGGLPVAEPAETGDTFEQNATIKAIAYSKATGRLCVADDSGLEIDALAGRPGVISSHYCTDGRELGMTRAERDAANNRRVLEELEGVPAEMRSARFVCVMVAAGQGGRFLHRVRGTFEGRVGEEDEVPRGENGFGYDPLFLVAPDFSRTSAELDREMKNRVSHRAAAARQMAEWLAAAGEERAI